jgi:hypothetical protein
MPKLPPPFRPLAVSIVVDRLRIVLPVAAVALVVVALTPSLALLLMPRPAIEKAGAVPPQDWTARADVLPMLSRVAPGALPRPDSRQQRPPCRTSIGEEAINGYCWLRLVVEPPCPVGEAYEHGGKCYAYVLRAEKVPTSGEPPIRAGVADP